MVCYVFGVGVLFLIFLAVFVGQLTFDSKEGG